MWVWPEEEYVLTTSAKSTEEKYLFGDCRKRSEIPVFFFARAFSFAKATEGAQAGRAKVWEGWEEWDPTSPFGLRRGRRMGKRT